MFDHLHGELVRKGPTEVVIDCGGVGYLASISLQSWKALPDRGRVKLLVHVHTTDTGIRLFGFVEEAERSFFRLLQSVRGIGPNLALVLLSNEAPDVLAARIRSGDVKGLTRIKGIGTKTAERLVLELKEKVGSGGAMLLVLGEHEQQLVQALARLGLSEHEAGLRARATLQANPAETRLEILLRHALKPGASSAAR